MLEAFLGRIRAKIDSIQVVNILGWGYADAPGVLAEKVGANPSHKLYTAVGGETPQRIVNETAEAIVNGTIRLALLAGSEAMASRNWARKAGDELPWAKRATPESVVGDQRMGFSDVESRHGAMALSWSMDKAGPMCRSAEDCGLVLEAIHGADGKDPSAVDRPYGWSPDRKITGLRIGYLKSAFDADHPTKRWDDEALTALRALGVELVPVELATEIPVGSLRIILQAESAAAFDELTRSNRDDLMTRQGRGTWPSNFRASRFIPAVEYINANRARTILMRDMDRFMERLDVFVMPSFGGNMLMVTNLTGHPSLTVPNGWRDDGGRHGPVGGPPHRQNLRHLAGQ